MNIATGYFTGTLFGKKTSDQIICHNAFDIHEQEICHCFPWGSLREQWRQCSSAWHPLRHAAFVSLCSVQWSAGSGKLLLFLFAVFSGQLGPVSWNWIRVTLVVLDMIAFFIVATVPDHFLEDHLWNHVMKDHVPQIFLWTFGALLLISILINYFHFEGWIQDNQLIILLIACLVGLIPESGPHLFFLTLFAEGTIPFSIFLASSIVQDGHGILPILAESRRDFLQVKTINFAVGLLTGLAGYSLGW